MLYRQGGNGKSACKCLLVRPAVSHVGKLIVHGLIASKLLCLTNTTEPGFDVNCTGTVCHQLAISVVGFGAQQNLVIHLRILCLCGPRVSLP